MDTATYHKKLSRNVLGFLLSVIATAFLLVATVGVAVTEESDFTLSIFAGMTVAGGIAIHYFHRQMNKLQNS